MQEKIGKIEEKHTRKKSNIKKYQKREGGKKLKFIKFKEKRMNR